MPTYEIRCAKCAERFDLFLMRFIRPEDLVCLKCGSRDVRVGVGGGILGSGTRESACVPRGGFT